MVITLVINEEGTVDPICWIDKYYHIDSRKQSLASYECEGDEDGEQEVDKSESASESTSDSEHEHEMTYYEGEQTTTFVHTVSEI